MIPTGEAEGERGARTANSKGARVHARSGRDARHAVHKAWKPPPAWHPHAHTRHGSRYAPPVSGARSLTICNAPYRRSPCAVGRPEGRPKDRSVCGAASRRARVTRARHGRTPVASSSCPCTRGKCCRQRRPSQTPRRRHRECATGCRRPRAGGRGGRAGMRRASARHAGRCRPQPLLGGPYQGSRPWSGRSIASTSDRSRPATRLRRPRAAACASSHRPAPTRRARASIRQPERSPPSLSRAALPALRGSKSSPSSSQSFSLCPSRCHLSVTAQLSLSFSLSQLSSVTARLSLSLSLSLCPSLQLPCGQLGAAPYGHSEGIPSIRGSGPRRRA